MRNFSGSALLLAVHVFVDCYFLVLTALNGFFDDGNEYSFIILICRVVDVVLIF